VSLRSRLWLVLGALVLLPVVVGIAVVLLVVPDVQRDQIGQRLDDQRAAAVALFADRCRGDGLVARSLALESAATSPRAAVESAVAGQVTYAAVLDPSGKVLADAGTAPLAGPDLLARPTCDAGTESSDAVAVARVAVTGGSRPGLTAVVLTRYDPQALQSVRSALGSSSDVTLMQGSKVVSSTASDARAAGVASARPTDIGSGVVTHDGRLVVYEAAGPGLPWTLALDEAQPTARLKEPAFVVLGLLVLAAVVALLALVARSLTRPITALTEQAEQVAQGRMDSPVDAGADAEVRRLSGAFNRITDQLRRNAAALEQSRDDLRDSLDRMGEALVSTHDVYALLGVALETALTAAPARAGVVLLTGADRSLELVAQEGLRDAGLAMPTGLGMGEGVLGRVAESGLSVRGRLGSGQPSLRPVPGEPSTGEVLAVPLRSGGRPYGVLALYSPAGEPFDAVTEEAMRTLAGQVGIAVDNVQLHREAQRLSTTDPLTGLWNFRYLSMSLAREVERSSRFQRPFAVLMLDLDYFKKVNDDHGHARGDTVLRELAERVQEQIREVDVFARYGGEEFVVVLPETTLDGATQLAERICAAIRREPFSQPGEADLTLTISAGVAAFPQHGGSPATLMRAADQALYNAKRGGRDRWCVASD
jgi:diguanylate cyclase (GGDEF)-like protein